MPPTWIGMHGRCSKTRPGAIDNFLPNAALDLVDAEPAVIVFD